MNIALISAPFFSVTRPCLQIGLLKAVLKKNEIDAQDFYLSLDLAEAVGLDFYEKAAHASDLLLGEWLFEDLAHGAVNQSFSYPTTYQNDLAKAFSLPSREQSHLQPLLNHLEQIKYSVLPKWIDSVLVKTNWTSFGVVGFSCTFAQINASLALAARIKQLSPPIKIMFGGSAFDGEMGEELMAHSPHVDCLVRGEGEEAIVEVLRRWESNTVVPRIITSSRRTDLNNLPPPNYDTYFTKVRKTRGKSPVPPTVSQTIPFETSRGCWWGEKHHCTFCGLNGELMQFRVKTPETILKEINFLSDEYQTFQFEATDNILDHKFFRSLIPQLHRGKRPFQFFFETKANLKTEELHQLSHAGFKSIQPGIESLSTEVLKLMKKGCDKTQNLHTLKWARHFDIDIVWNLLYGFPGEEEAWYREMIDLIPKISHLQPPGFVGPVRVDRFSPYFREVFSSPPTKSFLNVRPSPIYDLCFPPSWDKTRLAYYFLSEAQTHVSKETYDQLEAAIVLWQTKWSNLSRVPQFVFQRNKDIGVVFDSRSGTETFFEIAGDTLNLAELLDLWPTTEEKAATELNLSTKKIRDLWKELEAQGMVARTDHRLTWLPIRSRKNALEPFRTVHADCG